MMDPRSAHDRMSATHVMASRTRLKKILHTSASHVMSRLNASEITKKKILYTTASKKLTRKRLSLIIFFS